MGVVYTMEEFGPGDARLAAAAAEGIVAFEVIGDLAEAIYRDGTRVVLTVDEMPAPVACRGERDGFVSPAALAAADARRPRARVA